MSPQQPAPPQAQPPANPAALELAARLDAFFTGLLAIIAAQWGGLGGFVRLIKSRLARGNRHLATLLANLAAGRTPRPRAPRPARSGGPRAHIPQPRGFLRRHLGRQAGIPAYQLEMLLSDPATRELLARIPTAGRTLRPICRWLGVPIPAWLRLPRNGVQPTLPEPSPRPPRRPAPQPYRPPPPPTPDPPPDRIGLLLLAFRRT